MRNFGGTTKSIIIFDNGLYIYFFVFRLGLQTFVADNFPLKSTEFIKGGPQYNDYIQALDKVIS